MKTVYFVLLYILLWANLWAQSSIGAAEPTPEAAPETAESLPSPTPIPGGPEGYRKIKLGMDLETVKELLTEDTYFAYRGDPDVSFLPFKEQPLIECDGSGFIEKAYFQFHEDKLFILILNLDPRKSDYFTLYTTLMQKYGQPTSLSPKDTVWNFKNLRLSLERPLSIKYIDTEVFEKLLAESQAELDLVEASKKQFLDQF